MAVAKLVFGVTFTDPSPEKHEALQTFLTELGRLCDVEIQHLASSSYESLATAMNKDALDLAWLPPVVFLRTEPSKTKPLVAVSRGTDNRYHTALIVREDASYTELKDLVGARAAWVDPWSAAGFIIPRLSLMAKGLDPRTMFRAESFRYSHKAAVEAIVEGSADCAGTYASVDEEGKIKTGGWATVKDANVRVLAELGTVPPDLICHASRLDPALVEKFRVALTGATPEDALGKAAAALFQSPKFSVPGEGDYDALRRDLEDAEKKKLFAS